MLPPRRSLAAGAVVAALLATGLTGCSGSVPGGCPTTSGAGSDAVTATGPFDKAPTVGFSSPLHVSRTESTVLRTGSGAPITRGQEVVADLTLLNGTTGAAVTRTAYGATSGAASLSAGGSTVLPGLQSALVCARVGERLAIAIPPKEGFTSAQLGSSLGASDSLVVVADVRHAYLARADGTNQVMANGLPNVVLAPNGQPGISLPFRPAPKDLEIDNLKNGSGEVLKAGQTAVVQYTGWTWNSDGTAAVFDSSWTKGAPASLALDRTKLIKGFYDAVVGQRVGSQVLAVVPAKDGYGSAGSGSIPGGATLVFVIDVLGRA